MKGFLFAVLFLSILSYAGDGRLDKVSPDTLLTIKARTLQAFTMTIESQQDIISDLQWKLREANSEISQLEDKCTF